MTKTQEIEKRTRVFDACLKTMAEMYRVGEFTPGVVRAYFVVCTGWSEDKIRESFRRAMEGERFCPTVAVLKSYGATIREEKQVVLPAKSGPNYTPEQRAELDQWKREFAESFNPPPWMRDSPTSRRRRS